MKEENLTDIINEEISEQETAYGNNIVHDNKRTFFTMPDNYSELIEEANENQFNHDLLREENKAAQEKPQPDLRPQEIKEELTYFKPDENAAEPSADIKSGNLRVIQRDRDASLENQKLIKDRMTIGWLILNAAISQRITNDNPILIIKNKLKESYSDEVFTAYEKNIETIANSINLSSNILLTKLFSKETLHLEAEEILKKMNAANYKEEEIV